MIKLKSIITNGYAAPDTLEWFLSRGYTFVITIPAKLVHPHAMDTDKLSIFSVYTEPDVNALEGVKGYEGNQS